MCRFDQAQVHVVSCVYMQDHHSDDRPATASISLPILPLHLTWLSSFPRRTVGRRGVTRARTQRCSLLFSCCRPLCTLALSLLQLLRKGDSCWTSCSDLLAVTIQDEG